MDKTVFKNKCYEWLRDVTTVSGVQWILGKTKDADTVIIEARIRKKIIDGSFTLSQSFIVRCSTEDKEGTIHTAVLAVNEKVIELVQDDCAIWKAN